MVKGTSRRVIVVDSPDTELFEQAIFIVRNDAMNRNGVTAQRLVDEACRVARTCGRTATCSKRSFFRRGSPALWGCIGAGGIAPAVSINGKVYPKLSVNAVPAVIEEYKNAEANV